MRAPMTGLISFAKSCLRGTCLTFSGSRWPNPFSGDISTVAGVFISMVVKLSSKALSTQPSPTTTSLGSYISPSL